MGKAAKKHKKLHFDMPTPVQGVPWLVYPHQGTDEKEKFYSVTDGHVEERSNKLLHYSNCLGTLDDWMLIENYRTPRVFLFNPFSSQEFSLPRLIGERPNIFLRVFGSSEAKCYIVGIFKEKRYFLYTSPGGTSWRKQKLVDIWVDSFSSILTAASGNGKVYLLTSEYVLVVIQFTPCPVVEKFNTKNRAQYLLSRCDTYFNLVTSSGELFLVETIVYQNTKSRIVSTLMVHKLDCSTMSWVPAETLNGYVFVMSGRHSSSFVAANTKLKGNCIYRVSGNVLCYFDMEYQSLTTVYPLSDADYNECLHFWLVPIDAKLNLEQKQNYVRKESPNLACSYEKFLFDHLNCLSHTSRIPTSRTDKIIQHSKFWRRWHPRTPWLMFTHKKDGTYKVLDPCTKVAYELLVPDLAGYTIVASIDGWLFAQRRNFLFLLINPFSNEKMDLPHTLHNPFSVTFSAPPTGPDCKIFFISHPNYKGPKVQISIYQLGDDKWTTREFEETAAFQLAHSNAVYLNGCFYCLGMDGNLGVYDSVKCSWRVIGARVSIECAEACFCTLMKSQGKLLSAFLDFFQRPIGIFEFDLDLWQWNRITDVKERTFFFGRKTSFLATTSIESMRNMIYFPAFHKDYSLDLATHSLSSNPEKNNPNSSLQANTEYMHIWIEPKKGVLGGSRF